MFLHLAAYFDLMTSAMEQLIYVSTARASVAGGEVFDIIRQSSLRNPQRGITGFLVFTNGLFFQYVEGSAPALDTLLDDLSRDPRHHSITILYRRPLAERAFPGWKMKRLPMADHAVLARDMVGQLRELGIPTDAVREVSEFLSARAA